MISLFKPTYLFSYFGFVIIVCPRFNQFNYLFVNLLIKIQIMHAIKKVILVFKEYKINMVFLIKIKIICEINKFNKIVFNILIIKTSLICI